MRQGVIGDLVKVDLIDNAYSPYRWAHKPADLASVQERDTDWNAFLMDKPRSLRRSHLPELPPLS